MGPGVTAPRMTRPGTMGRGTMGRGTMGPGTMAPGTTGPGIMGPETTGPGLMAPGTTGPETTELNCATNVEATTPNADRAEGSTSALPVAMSARGWGTSRIVAPPQ